MKKKTTPITIKDIEEARDAMDAADVPSAGRTIRIPEMEYTIHGFTPDELVALREMIDKRGMTVDDLLTLGDPSKIDEVMKESMERVRVAESLEELTAQDRQQELWRQEYDRQAAERDIFEEQRRLLIEAERRSRADSLARGITTRTSSGASSGVQPFDAAAIERWKDLITAEFRSDSLFEKLFKDTTGNGK